MKSYQQLFAELKRRHVFKVAAIYGATAFVLLQLADLLVEALKLPADFLSMITVLVLLGFPVALIVAWAFELGPAGVRRTDRLHYVEGRYDEAYEQWSRIDPDLTREEFDAWTGYLEAGRLDAVPPEERQYLEVEDWLRIGEPDSAAAHLAEIELFDLDIQNVYRVWMPVYDSIRSHPRVQAFLGRYGLAGVAPQRTPVELREPPAVLREAGTPPSAGAQGSGDGDAAQ